MKKFIIFCSLYICFSVLLVKAYAAGYTFPGTYNCVNCSYHGCVKTDAGYRCATSESDFWNNCYSGAVLSGLSGGTCPVGFTCSQFYSKSTCTNNRCILVENPAPNSPTPTHVLTNTPTLTLTPHLTNTPTPTLTPGPIACGGTGCNTTPCQTGYTCVSNQCQLVCSAVQFQVPGNVCSCTDLPKCKPPNVDLNVLNKTKPLEPIFQGNDVVLEYNPVEDPLSSYKTISNTLSPNNPFAPFPCTPTKLGETPIVCKIPLDYPVITTQEILWTNNFKYCNNTFTDKCSPQCTETKTFNVNQIPGFFKTSLGNVYVKGYDIGINIPNFPNSDKFATYLLATNRTNFNAFYPLSNLLSTKNYLVKGYTDTNYSSTSTLKSEVLSNQKLTKKVISGDTNFTSLGLSSDYNVYEVQGDLTVDGGICNVSAIIFSNNLTINGNIALPANPAENAKSGCVFVVINSSASDGQTTIGSNVTNIDAFIVTDKYKTENGTNTNGLKLNGGLTITNELPTNSNFLRTIYIGGVMTNPSEEIVYEGARYIKLIRDFLPQTTSLSIRESQYNK